MSATSTSDEMPNLHPILSQLLFATIATISMMAGFWLVHGRTLATTTEVRTLIREVCPYNADRNLVAAALLDNRDITKALENNTRAIGALETAIAVLTERIENR